MTERRDLLQEAQDALGRKSASREDIQKSAVRLEAELGRGLKALGEEVRDELSKQEEAAQTFVRRGLLYFNRKNRWLALGVVGALLVTVAIVAFALWARMGAIERELQLMRYQLAAPQSERESSGGSEPDA